PVPGRRRVRTYRLGCLSTSFRTGLQPGRGGRLLHLGATAIGTRDDTHGCQLPGYRAENAYAWHEADGNADLHLDLHLRQRSDRGFVPEPDGDAGPVDA